tara:strand:+ start:137 stop:454 length:318 start_codon:yes stop_codon:yes gene_type:complete
MKVVDQKYINKLLNRWAKLEEKYFNLVWLARKYPEDYKNPKIAPKIKEVKDLYPEEVKDLGSPEEGDWMHGFNSGCLAAFRYILTSLEDKDGLQQADDEFPFLDT